MATRTLVVTLGQQFGGGDYAVKSAGTGADGGAAVSTADTAATSGTTDVATALTYMASVGLTGSVGSAVTLTAAQANSISAAVNLVSTDLLIIKAGTSIAAAATTAGDLVAIVNTTNLGSVGKLSAAFRAAETLAMGSGFSP